MAVLREPVEADVEPDPTETLGGLDELPPEVIRPKDLLTPGAEHAISALERSSPAISIRGPAAPSL